MNVVAEMLLTEPAPMAIWAILIVLTFPAMLLLGSPAGPAHPWRAARELVGVLRERDEQQRERAEDASRAARYADEVHVAAGQAAASAARWRQVWEQAEQDVTAAWQVWLDADARLREAVASAAWGTPWSVPTCTEYAGRERFLHRTVMAAVERGELPAQAQADVLAGRNGWDARLHPVEQQVVIARASVAWLRQRYECAVVAERVAQHDADLARRASHSLCEEARTAAAHAREIAAALPSRARATAVPTTRHAAVPAL